MTKLPYLPLGREIKYVPESHEFIQAAKTIARTQSLDPDHPTGAVIVKNNTIIGQGANGSQFHKFPGCLRKKVKAPTGTMYWICPGCSPKNHAEQRALQNCKQKNLETKNADLYLWGHWWCCKSCWFHMIQAGINNVYLPDNAEEHFKKGN